MGTIDRILHVICLAVCLAAGLAATACASDPPTEAGPAPAFDLEAVLSEAAARIAALDFQGALEAAGAAVEAAAGDARAWRQYAAALGYAGAIDDALAAYDKALALAPDDPRLLNARAIFLAKSGWPAEAVADADAALAMPRTVSNANLEGGILDTKAWALFLAGDYAGARAAEQRSVALNGAMAGYAPILEFRILAAEKGMAAAAEYAGRILDAGGLPGFAAQALEVMTGKKDIRDMSYGSAFEVSDFSLYVTRFTFAPASPLATGTTPVPATPAAPVDGAPVVLVTEPEATATDESMVAVAKLAFRDGLTKAGVFSVVDSDSRKAAFEELELSLSGATAGDRDVAAGALFSADFVASGSIVRTDTGWLMAYTFSDATTGRILASDMSIARDAAAILDLASRFSSGLAAMLRDGRIRPHESKD